MWQGWGLNPRPRAYESPALPLSYLAEPYIGIRAENPHHNPRCGGQKEFIEMNKTTIDQRTISAFYQDDYILTWIEAFLVDRKAQNITKGTIEFYRKKFKYFVAYCESQALTRITQITPTILREFLFMDV